MEHIEGKIDKNTDNSKWYFSGEKYCKNVYRWEMKYVAILILPSSMYMDEGRSDTNSVICSPYLYR